MKPPMTSDEPDIHLEDELTEEERELVEMVKIDEERREILDGLASDIEDRFQERVIQRKDKEVEWDNAQRLYNAPLSTGIVIDDGPFNSQSDTRPRRPEPNIIRTKCDTAVANSISLQFGAGEKNWDLFPPANVQDPLVTEACRQMEKEIEAQLSQTKYAMHSRRSMEERVILGTGVVKGPVNTGKLKVQYVLDPASGEWVPEVTENRAPKVNHVPLWRFFPDLSVTDFDEGEDVIEVHPMTSTELSTYTSHPGFDGDTIKEILYGNDRVESIKASKYNSEMAKIGTEAWGRNPYLYKDRYLVLEYHGPVSYDDIEKLGLTPTYDSPTAEYYGEIWVCCGRVIRMELENIEGYYETPYAVSPWKRDPSSPFGYGHPLILADAQRVVTQTYHMILDNAAASSGPQVAMFRKYIQPVNNDWTIKPNKVWFMTDATIPVDNAIKFFNVPNVIGNIMPVLNLARQFAEEESATAEFGGSQSPQNQDSATGQLIMQHASTTLLDFFAEEWDDQVTEKVIRRMYAWNMQYNPRQDIKGNYIIDVRSSSEYKNKQMYVRDMERLSMEAAQNPNMAKVVNMDELTRARLTLMKIPNNKIVRTPEEVAAIEEQEAANQPPDPEMVKFQIEMEKIEIKKQELALRAQEMQFKMQQEQQRAIMEHEQGMGANEARLFESQAQVLKARSEVEVEMLKLAQRDEQFKQKVMADAEAKDMEIRSKVFLKSMEEARKGQENTLFAKELEIKKTFGSGI